MLVKLISPLLGVPKNKEFNNFLYDYKTGTAPGIIYNNV